MKNFFTILYSLVTLFIGLFIGAVAAAYWEYANPGIIRKSINKDKDCSRKYVETEEVKFGFRGEWE